MKRKIYDDQLIIITGAAGCIGSNVVHHLNNKGFENLVLVDDFHESIKWKNLLGARYVDFVSKYEIFDWLDERENDIEAFIHLGANSSTTEKDGDYLLDNNYRFSVRLAEFALHNDHRFIYASSAATYGRGEQGFSDSHDLLDELRPMNLYGYTKHMFDLWLKRQGALDDVVGLKYFNIYGPREGHKGRMASMAYHMTKKILLEGKVGLFQSSEPEKYGDGDQVRDFLYVKDAAEMTCYFLENPEACGIYNIGMGKTHTWNQLAHAIFSALKKTPNIEYIPMPEDLVKQYQNYTLADMTKFKTVREEPFSPMDIEAACNDYVNNYLLTFLEENDE